MPEEKIFRRPRSYEDNIKMDLREMGCDAGDSTDLAQDRDQWWRPPLWSKGSDVASHLADPGSIPGRVSFLY